MASVDPAPGIRGRTMGPGCRDTSAKCTAPPVRRRTDRGSAFQQFADMGADRICKALQVVTAFEDRDETALAVLFSRFHQLARRPGEIIRRHAQRTERIAFMRIES